MPDTQVRLGPSPTIALEDSPAKLVVILGLAAGPAVALGLARFAYALLLPAMRSDLGWSYADAGAVNTANAAGYLAGALLAAPLGSRVGLARAYVGALVVTSAAVLASGTARDFDLLLLLRAVAGISGAVALVTGAALATRAAGAAERAPLVLGLYFGGGGIGIAASALAVPPLVAARGWQAGWLSLGAVCVLMTLAGTVAAARTPAPPAFRSYEANDAWSLRRMTPTLLGYALFGAGNIAYVTFIVAYLRTAERFSDRQVMLFWATLGIAAALSTFAWSPALGRLRRGWGVALTTWTVFVGAAIPLVASGAIAAYASALLFGLAFLAVVAAVTLVARRAAPPRAWTTAIAALTTAFGIGQCIGPVLSGRLSDGANGLRAGLWLSAGLLLLAGLVSAAQPEPRRERRM